MAGKLLPLRLKPPSGPSLSTSCTRGRRPVACRVLRLDDERAEQPLRHLLGGVVVRVVHVRAGVAVPDRELVDEGLARLDRRLGDERHAVHRVRDDQAVPVDRRALRQLVGDDDADLVAFGDADLRAGNDAVVGPGLDELAGLDFPLHDHRAGQLEDLDVAVHRVVERLAAESLRRRREGVDARLVHPVHLVIVEWFFCIVRRGCGVAVSRDREGADHPRLGVAGYGTDEVELACFVRRELDNHLLAGASASVRVSLRWLPCPRSRTCAG